MRQVTTLLCSFVFIFFSSFSFVSSATTENNQKPSVIALAPHIVEMLFDIGAGEQIIGTTAFADYPKQAEDIPVVGNYLRLQIEKIIAMQPDIIIAWKSGNPSDDLARLKQLGFKVIYSQPNNFNDVANEMLNFGELTKNSNQAKKQVQIFLNALKVIEQQYQDKPAIKAFYELWSNPLTTVAKGSWPQQFMNICKADNPFKQLEITYPQVNIENVLEENVQLIIQPLSKNQHDKIGFNWQDWPIIPAVKNKKIIQPNADAMHRMTMRSLGSLKRLCEDIDKTRQWLHSNTL